MIPHLQKEQSLGRFELTFFRLLTGSYPVQGLTSILARSVALTEPKLKGHNEILKNYVNYDRLTPKRKLFLTN